VPPAEAALVYANTRDPERRVRVGYLSPDFWSHPVARFIEPILMHHDRRTFEVWCYNAHEPADAVTLRLRGLAERWVDCAALTDEALAARIRADGIDVLVDLAGHTAGNRLLAVARRPAPVTATYLGYPTTTGIEAIRYRITDAHVDPADEPSNNVETPLRLPQSYYCYAEVEETREAAPLPAKLTGRVTFGCFNSSVKWSDEALRLWARVLEAIGGSTLLLKAKDLGKPAIAKRVLERFEQLGVDTRRIVLQGWEASRSDHFAVYDRVDIAVDTYPYNGATTTCEALSMGVPVVTLEGPTHASRMGASVLAAAGFPEWIAPTPERYVEICAALAGDLDGLQATRSSLRERLRASPLMDGARFTADLERLYREMWRSWCRGTNA
jgi:predicted O-linked N-acetylglucosamine transferase (SPINDLY family)